MLKGLKNIVAYYQISQKAIVFAVEETDGWRQRLNDDIQMPEGRHTNPIYEFDNL